MAPVKVLSEQKAPMSRIPERPSHNSRTFLWFAVAVVAVGCWLTFGAPLAEALNRWTARLAEMVLVDYPPGSGDTHYETY